MLKQNMERIIYQKKVQCILNKKSQDAHEAIRPSNFELPPDKLMKYLSKDQLRLYTLIWERVIASQMTAAIYDTVNR